MMLPLRETGPASSFCARPVPTAGGRRMWLCSAAGPAVVLGSTQPEGSIDHRRADAAGLEVARRRGGGGAVLVRPGELVWADVFVPVSDPCWSPDVSVAFHWLGRAWAGALADLGVAAEVHTGPLRRSPWSDQVCFAGLGPGEVTVAGRKVVGLSQRRTRSGALFFCAALLAWDPAALLDVLAIDDGDRRRGAAELAEAAAALPLRAGPLGDALAARLSEG